jgi:hypothetical protein
MNKLGNSLTKTSFSPKNPVLSQIVSNRSVSSSHSTFSNESRSQAPGLDPGKLHVLGTLHFGATQLTQRLLVDSGADNNFIDSQLVETLKLPLVHLPQPISLQMADGSPLTSGPITHETLPSNFILESISNQPRSS